jgi:hypothetical protein
MIRSHVDVKVKLKWLNAKMGVLVAGDEHDLKKLKFEEMYRVCYELCLNRHGKRLLTSFRAALARALAVHRKDKNEFVRRALMVTDVHMYAIVTRFNTHLKGENVARSMIDELWESRRVLRSAGGD